MSYYKDLVDWIESHARDEEDEIKAYQFLDELMDERYIAGYDDAKFYERSK